MIEQLLADGGIHSGHRVNSDADVELLHGVPKRIEIRMIKRARADGSCDHDTDRAERFDRVLQFLGGSLRILQRDDSRVAQPAAGLSAAFGDPGVVRAADRRGEAGVLQTVYRHQYVRIDDLEVDALKIEIGETAGNIT